MDRYTTMFDQYMEPILLERTALILRNGLRSPEERAQLAKEAVAYLRRINYTNSPHWNTFLSSSGLQSSAIPNPQYTENHDKEQCVVIKKIIDHNYAEALHLIEAREIKQSQYFRKMECLINLQLLSKDYHNVDELSHYFKNNTSVEDLIPEEKAAFRRIQTVICASYYQQKRFFDCCSHFFNYLSLDPEFLNEIITPTIDFPLISSKEIITMITLSCLIAIPLDNYTTFLYLPDIRGFYQIATLLPTCLELLIHTKFRDFFRLLEDTLGDLCRSEMFLQESWNFAQFTIRSKVYFFYIRISTQLEISYIASILQIPEEQTRQEIEQLISSAGLNVIIEDNVIHLKHKHLLEDAIEDLKENEHKIQVFLDRQAHANNQLKDRAQHRIKINDENSHKFNQTEDSKETNEDDFMIQTDQYDSNGESSIMNIDNEDNVLD